MFGNCHIAIGESLGKQASKSEWAALAVLAVRAVLAAFVDAVALCCRCTLLLADGDDGGAAEVGQLGSFCQEQNY